MGRENTNLALHHLRLVKQKRLLGEEERRKWDVTRKIIPNGLGSVPSLALEPVTAIAITVNIFTSDLSWVGGFGD